MSADAAGLLRAFEHSLARADRVRESWLGLTQSFAQLLGEGAARTLALDDATAALESTLDELRHAVRHPTLVVATTGTTSGGKSAIVNYLCGAPLMPVAVQEMSAGVVKIEHAVARWSVTIEPTERAPWETGEFPVSTADEVRKVLEPVMNIYRAHRDAIAPPAFHVRFPMRFGADQSRFGLPVGARIVLLDLPGLNYVGDESNGHVIREMCRQALCLVTVNSEAADPTTRAELVKQVVSEVRKLRGSPARMLFIANRIDAFNRDRNPLVQAADFINALERDIRARIADALPESAHEARTVRVLPFSSEPALHARVLRHGSDRERHEALVALDRHYQSVIPEAVLNSLPRDVRTTPRDAQLRLADEIAVTSHANRLDEALEAHIGANLPRLILPHLLAAVRDSLVGPLASVDAYLTARRAAAEARCDEEIARIEDAAKKLVGLRERIAARTAPLRAGNWKSEKPEIIREMLAQAVPATAKNVNVAENELKPLTLWISELHAAGEGVLAEVSVYLSGAAKERPFRSLPDGPRLALVAACDRLHELGYRGEQASKGGRITRKGPTAEAELKEVRKTLRGLARAVVPALKATLEARSEIEADRIYAALGALLQAQNDALVREATRLAPELRGLQLAPSRLQRIDRNLRWSIDVTVDADLTTTTKSEVVRHEATQRSRRLWYWAWLKKETWEEQVPVYGDVDYHHIDVPPVDELCGGFFEQFKESNPEATFVAWLDDQLRAFEERVTAFHDERLAEYRRRLVDAKKATQTERDDAVRAVAVLKEHAGAAQTAAQEVVAL